MSGESGDVELVVSLPERMIAGPAAVTGRRLARILPAPLAVAACAAVATWWPFWRSDFALGLINLLVPISFVAIGVILREDRTQRTTGTLMLLAAPCYMTSWWWAWPPSWQVGPLPLISFTFGYFWFVCGGLALVRYPDARLGRPYERVYFAAMAVWVGLLKVAIVLVSRPEWNRFPVEAWWPSPMLDRKAFEVLRQVFDVGITAIAVLLLVVLVLKVRRSRGLDRMESVPVVVAACAVAVCGGAYFVVRLAEFPDGVVGALRAATGVAALVTPLAFLAAVLQRGLARSSVADLVLRLAETPSVDGVQRAIRATLQDPSLLLMFWLPTDGGYVDAGGRPWRGDARGQWSVPVESRDGRPLALLLIDPALRRHPSLVESVVVAGGFALENGRLHADVAAQLQEVRASRTRIVEETMAERRRLERNLHDGAQQSLLAVTTSLSKARLHASADAEVTAAIDEARSELTRARRELRDLARGIHPAVLSQSGLAPAVEGVAERLGLPVEVTVPGQRLSPAVESTCYFVVAEALTNIVKHAAASQTTVTINVVDQAAQVVVADDGCGGAAATPGSGLSGLVDRVRALGGDLTVMSATGSGTIITATVPCE